MVRFDKSPTVCYNLIRALKNSFSEQRPLELINGTRAVERDGPVAQLGEHRICIAGVRSSKSPPGPPGNFVNAAKLVRKSLEIALTKPAEPCIITFVRR